MTRRIPFGLDRLPRSLPADDPRLPGVTVGAEALRFNTEPLPPEAMEAATPDHSARVAAMKSHLHTLCGGYAAARVRFVDAYVDALSDHIDAHRDALARDLARYDGLYAPDDWLWSALRPLPRAWLAGDAGMVGVDVAFWDGARVIAIELGGRLSDERLTVCRITPEMCEHDRLLIALPDGFLRFWETETLPRSPFRRPIPTGVLRSA
jgi:hypothetical protein